MSRIPPWDGPRDVPVPGSRSQSVIYEYLCTPLTNVFRRTNLNLNGVIDTDSHRTVKACDAPPGFDLCMKGNPFRYIMLRDHSSGVYLSTVLMSEPASELSVPHPILARNAAYYIVALTTVTMLWGQRNFRILC